MIKSKFSQGDKPKVITTEHIPDDLGSNYYGFERLKLLGDDGKFAARYKNSGSIVLGNVNDKDKEPKNVKNLGQIVSWEIDYPHLVSIHDNDVLQICNVESGFTEKVQGDKDTIKKVQCILLLDQTIYCISPTNVTLWEKSNLNSPRRVIPLVDTSDPLVRPLINVKHNFSYLLSPSTLLLANPDVFQIWQISNEKNEMNMKFEGRNENSQSKYFGVYCFCDVVSPRTVVTTYKEFYSIWDISRSKEAAKNPREQKESGIITAVYLDDSFLILGTADGLLTVRHAKDGEKISELNQVDTQEDSTNSSLLDVSSLENRVNRIEKYGRWVFSMSENAKFSIYDLTQERCEPVYQYSHTRNGNIKDLFVGKTFWLLQVNQAPKSKGNLKDNDLKQNKPDIVQLITKLPGFEYYYDYIKYNANHKKQLDNNTVSDKGTLAMEGSSMVMILNYNHNQISDYLGTIAKAGEDVTEFTSMIDRVSVVAIQIVRNNHHNIPFKTLKSLHKALDEYESLMEKLTSTGKLVRFFTSSRLRRGLEIQNSALHSHLTEIEELIRVLSANDKERDNLVKARDRPQSVSVVSSTKKDSVKDNLMTSQNRPVSQSISVTKTNPGLISSGKVNQVTKTSSAQTLNSPVANIPPLKVSTTNLNAPQPVPIPFSNPQSMITDVSGREFWNRNFGNVLMVEFKKFMDNFIKFQGSDIPMADQSNLRNILDHGDTNYVSQYRFSEFLKGFGPFENCLVNVRNVLQERWFHGFLSSREAELLLKTSYSVDGTYLVRFSKSKPGSFAMAFVKNQSVRHILIESDMPRGLSVNEQDNTGNARIFKSLQEIIQHYDFVLKFPYASVLPQKIWFHGDLSAEESNDLLSGEPIGTFLVRFSSKGTFAASFIDSKGLIRHVLIISNRKDCFEVNTGDSDTVVFTSITDLVTYYNQKGVFQFPLKTANQQGTM